MSDEQIDRLVDEMEDRLVTLESEARYVLIRYENIVIETVRLKKFISEHDCDGYWEAYHYPIDNDDLGD